MKKFIKNNLFLSVSLGLLILVLSIIAIAYIPKDNKSKNEEIELHEKLPSELDEIGESGRYIKTKDTVCPAFEGIMYAYDGKFVTNIDNEYYLYEYVIEKKYSDESNCRLLTKLDKKPILFTYDYSYSANLGSSYILDTWIIYEDLTYALMSNPNEYNLKKEGSGLEKGTLLEDGTWNFESDTHYELRKWNGKTDSFKIKNMFGVGDSQLVVKMCSITNSRCGDACNVDNQFIESLTTDNPIKKYLNGAVVTEYGIYTWGVTDDSCMTYVDKECKKGFKRNYDLSKRYDDIAFVDELYVVFKDGTTYLHYDN